MFNWSADDSVCSAEVLMILCSINVLMIQCSSDVLMIQCSSDVWSIDVLMNQCGPLMC